MSNQRLISSRIWEDEFFIQLNIFEKLLWIGLISACADDQGRIANNPSLIRSKIFPTEDVNLEEMKDALNKFICFGKLQQYSKDKKNCLQILNWWKHQNPRWANSSPFPPPDNWLDRERYHGKGNEIYIKNWEYMGGFNHNLIKRNNKVKDEVEVKEEYSILNSQLNRTLNSDSATSFSQTGDSVISRVFSKVTGMTAIPGSELSKVVPAMDALHKKFPSEEDFINYLKPFYEWWKKQKRKDNVPYSKTNCSWIYDIAISGEIPEKPKEKPQKEIVTESDGGMYL